MQVVFDYIILPMTETIHSFNYSFNNVINCNYYAYLQNLNFLTGIIVFKDEKLCLPFSEDIGPLSYYLCRSLESSGTNVRTNNLKYISSFKCCHYGNDIGNWFLVSLAIPQNNHIGILLTMSSLQDRRQIANGIRITVLIGGIRLL